MRPRLTPGVRVTGRPTSPLAGDLTAARDAGTADVVSLVGRRRHAPVTATVLPARTEHPVRAALAATLATATATQEALRALAGAGVEVDAGWSPDVCGAYESLAALNSAQASLTAARTAVMAWMGAGR